MNIITPPQKLTAIRTAMGASPGAMALTLGFNGGRLDLKMEDLESGKRAISGPVLRLMDYLEQCVDIGDQGLGQALLRCQSEFVPWNGVDAHGNDFSGLQHTRFPRFQFFQVDRLPVSLQTIINDAYQESILWTSDFGDEFVVVLQDHILQSEVIYQLYRAAARLMNHRSPKSVMHSGTPANKSANAC